MSGPAGNYLQLVKLNFAVFNMNSSGCLVALTLVLTSHPCPLSSPKIGRGKGGTKHRVCGGEAVGKTHA